MALRGMALITVALGILIVPGLMYNNLNNTGLVPAQTLTCPGYPDVTCQGSVNVGCQANSNYCSLVNSGGQPNNVISFLTVCSPFTGILSGNFIAFINSFFSNCGVAATQSTSGQLSTFAGGNVTIPGLHATYSYHTLSAQRQWYTSQVLHPVAQGLTLNYYVTCLNWNGTASNTAGHGQYTTPCNFVDSSSPQIGYTMSCWLFKNLNGSDITNGICNNWATNLTGSVNFGNILGFGLWLLGAAIIILLALGIGFSMGGSLLASGATAGISSNRQGSKIAQVFGIGLLIWIPLYSEFNVWFTSGVLPYGFDGTTGIVSIVVTGMMAVGLWDQTTSD